MTRHQWLWFSVSSCLFAFASYMLFQWTPYEASHYDIDSSLYSTIAKHFYATSHLGNPYNDQMPSQALGYPFFVGVLYKIFGIHLWAIVCAQVLLSILSCFFIFNCTLLLFGTTAAYISIILAFGNLGFLIFSQFVMTEILLITLLVGSVYTFLLFMHTKHTLNLVFCALWGGISVMVKPVAILYSICLMICILVWAHEKYLQKAKYLVLLYSFFCIPILGYMTFNKVTYNSFSLSPAAHENLYIFFLPKLRAALEGIDSDTATKEILSSMSSFSNINPQRWHDAHNKLLSIAVTHPFLVLKVWMVNVFKTFFGLFSTQLKLLTEPTLKGGDCSFFKTKGSFLERCKEYIISGTSSPYIQIIALLEALWTILRSLLITYALFVLLKTKNYFLFCFFVGSILYFSIITGHDGSGRYRMMFEPFLIILTSYALSVLYKHKKYTVPSYVQPSS